jgi:hypothetical protein
MDKDLCRENVRFLKRCDHDNDLCLTIVYHIIFPQLRVLFA